MRIKEIEARLAAIKQEIEQRGDAMTAAEIDALEQETTQLTEERAGLIAAAEKRNGILDNIAKGAGIVSRSFQQNNGDDNAAPDDPFGTPEYRSYPHFPADRQQRGCYYSGQSFRYAGISFRVAEKHSPTSAERRREARIQQRQRRGCGGYPDADRERDYQQGKDACAYAE